MEKVCRLCGVCSDRPMYNIFSKNECGQQLIQLIKQCLPILVYRTDPLTKDICGTCYVKLNDYSSFQKSAVDVHDKFRENLRTRLHLSPVRLYLDTVENAYQPETIQISNLRSPRPVRNCASQINVETKSNYTNTNSEPAEPMHTSPIPSLKILTPSLINEKSSESNILISLLSGDGTIQKKRRLAGPKSRTRIQQIFYPQTLLQCALKQINRNLNLVEDTPVSDNTSAITSEYSISRSESQEIDDIYSSESLLEPNIHITVMDYDFLHEEINIHEPVMCNYCLKNFDNMSDLAYHEINHIKVDIGPKCDTPRYGQRCRNYVRLYQNYVARMNSTEEIATTQKPKPKPEFRKTKRQMIKVNHWQDRTQHEENNLLVPQPKDDNSYNFTIVNYEVFVNETPIKSMTKEDRRLCYKEIIINETKRKFCPLCRHTFKDNWAIETHYTTDMCQFTCKYCGRKFKNQHEMFEQHLLQHKGEPINKVFGPTDRRYRFKRKFKKANRAVIAGQMISIPPPKIKPIKIKNLMQKKAAESPQMKHTPVNHSTIKQPPVKNPPVKLPPMKIKKEPDLEVPQSSNRARTEPYQAYFCRKCFKVFFNVNEYNKHIRVCNGNSRKNSKSSEKSSESTTTTPEHHSRRSATATPEHHSRRPVRSCVKDISNLANESDSVDSDDVVAKPEPKPVKTSKPSKLVGSPEKGYECGICCSSFPSKFSRNSHMRIHKGQKTPLNKVAPKSHTITKQEPPQISNNVAANVSSELRLANLNPAVARLVQNNPHLTIRSFSKAQAEKHQQEKIKITNTESLKISEPPADANDSTPEHNIKRVYKCADCEDKFENKSVLYYHKMNSCVVKRHYECAFCRKKFGTYDQYNTHMFYVHPE